MADVPGRERFPRGSRLRRRVDFLAAQDRGRRFSSPHYLLLVRRRGDEPAGKSGKKVDKKAGEKSGKMPGKFTESTPRLGITVSRKVGGAVDRNRVKRWVRESYRRLRSLAPQGMDLVVIARPTAPSSGLAATMTELRSMLERLPRSGRPGPGSPRGPE